MKININEFGDSPRLDPLAYPGKFADHTYLLKHDHIEYIDVDNKRISDIFKEFNINDDVIIIGYGSNGSPAQLSNKFPDDEMLVLKGYLTGYDVVYAAAFASYGSIPATLIESPGTLVTAWANILNREQLIKMNASEGFNNRYQIIEIDSFELENGAKIKPAYAYAHSNGAYMHGTDPISLTEIEAYGRKHDEKTQEEMFNLIGLSMDGINVQEYLSYVKNNHKSASEIISRLGSKINEKPTVPKRISDLEI